jgi:hypothetical protein
MNPAKLALVVRHEHGAERQRVGSDEGLGRPKANPTVYILSSHLSHSEHASKLPERRERAQQWR